jgi:DNA primase small subunit
LEKTQEFIQSKFAQWYKQNSNKIQAPSPIEKRELAFLLFKGKVMLRHKGFKRTEDFRSSLTDLAPSDVYYSSAYYSNPEEEMSAKGWIGADLVFDIDADHIPTPCKQEHDTWKCRNCGTIGRGAKPEECPKCAGQKFDTVRWPCETCLEVAKKETIKLTEVLDADFGFSPKELKLAFSGHRGYHVHVENEAVRTLSAIARKEIVDYMMGIGLEPTLHGFDFQKGTGPSLEDSGWRGRLARAAYESLISTQEQQEKSGSRKGRPILQQKERTLERWNGRGPWVLVGRIGPSNWKKIMLEAVEKQSVKIDTVVTTDVHRLIRLSDTLHGETGLKKMEFAAEDVERFDPLKGAIAFADGTINVEVAEAPQFRLGDTMYGPYKNQRVELPTSAAMFLLCKGVAKALEEPVVVQ